MDVQTEIFALIVALVAALFKIPFLNFPIDEDFAFHTYCARFSSKGIKWKKDMLVFLPTWKMFILEALYGKNPETGPKRVRLFLLAAHVATSLIIFFAISLLTGNSVAALAGSLLYAFFATSPVLYTTSFNYEQLYVPLALAGLLLLWSGADYVWIAALCFGLTVILKYPVGIYIPALAIPVAYYYGAEHALIFIALSALPSLISCLIDWKLGFLDEESRKQINTRLAVSMKLPNVKKNFGNTYRDMEVVVKKTAPLWIAGIPAIYLLLSHTAAFWFAIFILATLAKSLLQKGASRYHFLPWIAILSITSGMGINYFLKTGGAPGGIALLALALLSAWTVKGQIRLYLRPTDNSSLAEYKKFDQFIYLPHFSKTLKRLARKRKESGRIFVWGTYTQIYHYTGMPASDQFIHYAVGPWDDPLLAGYFDTVISGIIKHEPIYIIKSYPNLNIDLLAEVTGLRYKLVKVALARFPVYRLASREKPKIDPLALSETEKLKIFDKMTEGKTIPGIDYTDFDAGHYRRAIKECRTLLRLNGRDAEGLYMLGRLYERIGLTTDATSAFEKLVSIEPKRPVARLFIAKHKIGIGELPEAEDYINDETKLFGENANSRFCRGLIAQKQGKHEKALGFFEEALTDEPQNFDFRLHLAKSLVASDKTDSGRKTYNDIWEMALEQNREWIRSKIAVDIARIDKGQKPEHETLNSYLQRDNENESLKYALAVSLEADGQLEEAGTIFAEISVNSTDEVYREKSKKKLSLATPPEKKVKVKIMEQTSASA